MIPIIKGLNQLIYFLLELAMVAALGYMGFQSNPHPYGRYVAGVGLPLTAVVLWAIFAAPRSPHRLEVPYRSVFALTLFGLTALLLYQGGYPRLAITFGLLALASELLGLALKQ